jgi:hypothetical protein
MGGRDTRTSTAISCRPPSRSTTRSWREAQELALQIERQVADLVEKERAALGALDLAGGLPIGAGEGAALVAEELGLEQGRRDGGAVDRHEALLAAWPLAACSAWAASSLPVPLSPTSVTLMSVGPARSSAR